MLLLYLKFSCQHLGNHLIQVIFVVTCLFITFVSGASTISKQAAWFASFTHRLFGSQHSIFIWNISPRHVMIPSQVTCWPIFLILRSCSLAPHKMAMNRKICSKHTLLIVLLVFIVFIESSMYFPSFLLNICLFEYCGGLTVAVC